MLPKSVPLGFILVPKITVLPALICPEPNPDFATFCGYRSAANGTLPDKTRLRSRFFVPKSAYSKASYPCGHCQITEHKLAKKRSDVFFQVFFHAIRDAKASVASWAPKGGHEV